jgi:hypothetical protein
MFQYVRLHKCGCAGSAQLRGWSLYYESARYIPTKENGGKLWFSYSKQLIPLFIAVGQEFLKIMVMFLAYTEHADDSW